VSQIKVIQESSTTNLFNPFQTRFRFNKTFPFLGAVSRINVIKMAKSICEKIQSADWKSEKHVPVIEAPDTVKADEMVKVVVQVGKEIAHPNTVEHHIRWIHVYFTPDEGKFTYDLGRFTFESHGEGPVSTHSAAAFHFKTNKSGTLNAVSYCNIHGLWESSKAVKVE
jgi:superoxide reductase